MINFNNHNITAMTYNNHSIKYAYGCGGIVWRKSEGYADMYFTIIPSRTTCVKKHSGGAYQYSLDSGNTWINADSSTSITVQKDKQVMFKGTESPSGTKGIGTFSVSTCGGSIIGDCKFEAMGNIMSLLYGDNFRGQTSLVGKDYAFSNLFYKSHITSAENLVLPATTLSRWCYCEMFLDCSYLTKAPKLPATTLAKGCYVYMFRNCKKLTEAPDLLASTLVDSCYEFMFISCSSLNKIVCTATNPTEENNNTYEWVRGVASAGTFYKAAGTTWPIGINGIPTGWVVKDYEPPTPPFSGKWKATYSDSRVFSAECDSTSAITQNEITKTNLISVEIGDCVTRIDSGAFYQYGTLKEAIIGNNVTNIDRSAFLYCSGLTSVNIPNGVTTIGESAFGACSGLTSLVIPDSVTSIGNSAFTYCYAITNITIPNGVTEIKEYTFDVCSSLTSVTIGNGVTSIGDYAFHDCESLTSITIPSGVTSIGYFAFASCSGLTSVTVNATTPPTLSSSVFSGTNNCPIYVPASSVELYKSQWSGYASRIQPIQ